MLKVSMLLCSRHLLLILLSSACNLNLIVHTHCILRSPMSVADVVELSAIRHHPQHVACFCSRLASRTSVLEFKVHTPTTQRGHQPLGAYPRPPLGKQVSSAWGGSHVWGMGSGSGLLRASRFHVGLPPIVRGSICLDVRIREGKNRDPLDGHLSGNFPRECGTRVELHITRTRGE